MTALCGLFYGIQKMANTDIKWFSFDNLNAPQLSNTWGCLVDLLDACLVNGFGAQTVASIVISDGVGIATFNNSHSIKQFQVVEFSGANEPALNSEFKVLGLTANTIEFLIDLPDQTATGTISCKLAPLGWTKVFSGTQKAVYQAKDIVSNPYFLRVDNSRDPVYTDTYAKFAKVGLLESCAGIDDVSGNQVPFDTTNPTKNWVGTGSGTSAISGWFKWKYASATVSGSFRPETTAPGNSNREWLIVGNASGFYILTTVETEVGYSWAKVVMGVGICRKRDIATPFLLAYNQGSSANTAQYFQNPLLLSGYANFAFIRNVKGVLANNNIFGTLFGAMSTYSGYAGTVQQDSNDGDVFTDILIKDPSNFLAGVADLAKYVLHDSSTDADFRFVINNGRAYLYCRTATNVTTGASTMLKTALAFDLGEI